MTRWSCGRRARRAACAAGDREVVLDPQADITLSGDGETDYDEDADSFAPGTGPLRLADGTKLSGGTLQGGWGLEVNDGATVRIEGVAILDSPGTGIIVKDGGVVAVQGGRIARSRSSGVGVDGAGSRASLMGVAVEDSRGHGIFAGTGGVVSLHGGSVSGSGDGDYYEDYYENGSHIEHHCPPRPRRRAARAPLQAGRSVRPQPRQ